MKLRADFVTNSSSSSYILAVLDDDFLEAIKRVLPEIVYEAGVYCGEVNDIYDEAVKYGDEDYYKNILDNIEYDIEEKKLLSSVLIFSVEYGEKTSTLETAMEDWIEEGYVKLVQGD